MKTEIILLISAGVTFLLAIAAFWTIRQNYSLQRRERRERLLNEIIDWAIEILKFDPIPKQTVFEPKFTEEKPTVADVILLWQVELQTLLRPIIAKGAYVNRISKTYGKTLWSATNEAAYCLGNIIEYINKLENTYSSVEALKKPNEDLRKSAILIIEEATKIKTRDIGKKGEDMSNEDEAKETDEPTIKDIEEHLKRQDRQTKWRWLFSLGVSVMAVGLTWFIATTTRGVLDFNSLFIFFVGLIIALLALFYRCPKKS